MIPTKERTLRNLQSEMQKSLAIPKQPDDDMHFLRDLSRGSFGEASQLVFDKRITDFVVLRKYLNEDKEAYKRQLYYHEVCFHHPTIISFYGVIESSTSCQFLEEYISGDLRGLVKPNVGLPDVACKHIVKQLEVALRFLHDEVKIAHGSLTPDNIMVSSFKQCEIRLNLEHAVPLGRKTSQVDVSPITDSDKKYESYCGPQSQRYYTYDFTGAEMARKKAKDIASLPFVSPEMIAGRPVTRSCDKWSLAMLMAFCVTGTTPWTCASTAHSSNYATFVESPANSLSHMFVVLRRSTNPSSCIQRLLNTMKLKGSRKPMSNSLHSYLVDFFHRRPAERNFCVVTAALRDVRLSDDDHKWAHYHGLQFKPDHPENDQTKEQRKLLKEIAKVKYRD